MADPLVRRNVYDLGGDWADPVLWYARGVRQMMTQPVTEPTGWRFYAAIHGIEASLWRGFGYLADGEALPPADVQRRFFAQCQHGSWYFLPWHRGYVLAFERVVRAAVVALGGPTDWTLPYWNYFGNGQNGLPPAFASASWPDGANDNPLYTPFRWGPRGDPDNVFVDLDDVNLDALNEPRFVGTSRGTPGFGGLRTGFQHDDGTHGGIESQPHDWVHSDVGGSDPDSPVQPPRIGLMGEPDTAGLDPIFWLHHANIDRLWETWRTAAPATHVDPADPAWRDGPQSSGQRGFVMPLPDGSTLDYTPGQMSDLAALGYAYDDLSPAGAPAPADRMLRLTGTPAETEAAAVTHDDVELVGANDGPLPVTGGAAGTSVRLDAQARAKVTRSLARAAEDAAPDRVFLNLENVRGLMDSTSFRVYVGPPGEADQQRPELLAGRIALFGVRAASRVDGEHAGQGVSFVLEITRIVDELHLGRGFDLDDLQVHLVPAQPVPEAAGISIGRVSVYRQGTGAR